VVGYVRGYTVGIEDGADDAGLHTWKSKSSCTACVSYTLVVVVIILGATSTAVPTLYDFYNKHNRNEEPVSGLNYNT